MTDIIETRIQGKGGVMIGCAFSGCDRPRRSRDGFCGVHAEQQRRRGFMWPIGQPPVRLCEFPGCERKHMARGLCAGHTQQRIRGQDLRPLVERPARPDDGCAVEGCEEPYHARGWCRFHYRRQLDGRALEGERRPVAPDRGCEAEGCDGEHYALGKCSRHYRQAARARAREGRPSKPAKRETDPQRKAGPRRRPKASKPESTLPKGWLDVAKKPAPKRRDTSGGSSMRMEIPPVVPNPPEVDAACLRTLAHMGHTDLAEMLGLAAAEVPA